MSEGGSYDPKSVEPEIRKFWDEGDYFHAEPDPEREPYSIVIPPPNVTGALHLGHALNNTLQDILIRTKRMQGYNTCWLPGTDHAGIATQAVVERRLREDEGKTRHEVGREGLVERIWAWKEDYGNRILNQLRLMGCSCDWQRTSFTLDEKCARAVYETFFRLFKDGLIFRGKRLVNWDTQLQTAVSDDEVYHENVKGHLWHIRYPVLGRHEGTEARRHEGEGAGRRAPGAGTVAAAPRGGRRPEDTPPPSQSNVAQPPSAVRQSSALPGSAGASPSQTGAASSPEQIAAAIERASADDAQLGRDYLMVATTRPETMLADTAVAVHPNDERYKHLIGTHVLLPLMNRPIPVIADGILVDPEFGTGAVKVTPGHDPNDYECGLRHDLAQLSMMTPDGKVSEIGRSEVRHEGTKARRHEGDVAAAPRGGRRPLDTSDEKGESTDTRRPPGAAAATGGAGVSPAYDYVGLSMDAARKQMVADLEAAGLMDRIEPYETEVGHSDRSKTPIQPFLSEQWFVKMGELAELAMEAVRDERVQFFPQRFAKSYLDWLGEKRDWCISRQLWWGHRIPVWTLPSGTGFTDPSADPKMLEDAISGGQLVVRPIQDNRELKTLGDIFGVDRAKSIMFGYTVPGDVNVIKPGFCPRADYVGEFAQLAAKFAMKQDPDVLDTWFSSALWPFSTFGWPGEQGSRDQGTQGPSPASAFSSAPRPLDPSTPSDLNYFYPTNVLSTARDIISLWVARMVMTSEYLNGRAPFQHVLIHPTILDGRGKRMSKTAGNGLDPLDLIEHYGTDAMRYSLAALAGDTQDVRIPVEYLCPHCEGLTPQKPKHLGKAIVACDHCKKDFATRIAGPDLIKQHGLGLSLSERFEDGKRFCNKLWQVATGFVIPNVAAGAPAGRAERGGQEGEKAGRREGEGAGRGARGAEQGTGNGERATGADSGPPSAHVAQPPSAVLQSAALPDDLALEDRWILSRLTACIEEVNRRRDRYQFSDMINALYSFFWGDFCDWYVELVKPRLYAEGAGRGAQGAEDGPKASAALEGEAPAEPDVAAAPRGGRRAPESVQSADTARRVLAHVLDTTLRLLHPVMPFITERLWKMMAEKGAGRGAQGAGDALCIAAWPASSTLPRDLSVEEEIQHTQDVIRSLRDIRAQVNALRSQAKEKALRALPRALVRADGRIAAQLRSHRPMLLRLGQCESIEIDPAAQKPPKSASKVLHGVEIYVPLEGLADPSIERGRLEKEREQLLKHLKGLEGKLANEKFVNNAAADIVQRERDRHAQLKAKLEAVERNLADLG